MIFSERSLVPFFKDLVEESSSLSDEELHVYLVGVLVSGRFTGDPLGLRCRAEKSPEVLRLVGDEALLVSGFFPERLGKYGLSVGYYASIGSAAYGRASVAAPVAIRPILWRLSQSFPELQELIRDVRERCDTLGLDLWSAYDQWLQTGSRVIERRLVELGGSTLLVRA